MERGTVELSREFVRRSHTSTVISSGGRLAAQIERDGARHVTLDVRSKNPLTALYRATQLRQALTALKPDIVHFRSRVPGWLFIIANRSLRLPFVSTVHGFNSVSAYSKVMTRGRLVICPSNAVADHIRRHYATPPEKIRIIHRGLDSSLFDPSRLDTEFMANFRRQHNLDNRFVVLGVGRVTNLKGYDVLLRATALARAHVPAVKTVIVGGIDPSRTAYSAELHRLVLELGLEEHVVFVGSQSRLAEIYACGDVLVSANKEKPEAFGRSMVEALAMGCPVIATRFGGALDIVRDGINGWLVDPGDAQQLAERLAQIPSAAFSGLRENALRRFSLEHMVEQTLAVYAEALLEAGRATAPTHA
ncbi:MAG: glycosyltransferase family 4 protein [Kiritimatiellae bacterium]|nr:glycosyltransferase family 4 protein [Kiritimatiellia bacterium]